MARSSKNYNQRLNGQNPLSYIGTNSYQPPEFVEENRPPTTTDRRNFQLGAIWLDRSSYPTAPTANDIYMLVSLSSRVATWVPFEGVNLQTLTGNSGGAVGPDGAFNVNIVGDATTINVVGNPGTNTLTISVIDTAVIQTLTGDSGGVVSPTAGDISTVGSGVITVVGNPGTSTLTVTPSGDIASSFITNPATGTATPSSGVLTFAGTNGITCSAAGSTVTVDGTSIGSIYSLQSDDTNVVTPTANIINIAGGSNLATTGTSGPNTLTVNLDGITQYSVQVGGASNDLTQIANGTTGQVLTAVTGSDPIWSTNASSYSTGTFTPSLSFGGGSTGITYSQQTGYYVQISNIVHYTFFIFITSKGSSTGDAAISGLPFTVLNSNPPYFDSQAISIGNQGGITLDTNYVMFYMSGTANTTTGTLMQSGSGQTEIAVDDTNFSGNNSWTTQGFYVIE